MKRSRQVAVKRIYDPVDAADGTRVLVDRVWPRGISKDKAHLDEWCKDVAPSTELRKWYDHDPAKYESFRERYSAELAQDLAAAAFSHLEELASSGQLTLLTASKAVDISQAAVLASLLNDA